MNPTISALLVLAVLSAAAAQAPLYGVGLPTTIPDEYIVVFQRNSTKDIRDLHVSELRSEHAGVHIINVFAIGELVGYSAKLDGAALKRELTHPNVRYIETNQVVHAVADTVETQRGVTWGLGRVSTRDLPLSGDFYYYRSAGEGVDAYVIDTGIYLSHEEFVGRAHFGANFVTGEQDDDCNGHGTHVAGTIGGKIYGVAKAVTLIAVKVLGCDGSGTYAGVIGGIDWAASHHKEKGSKRAVANMSLGGGASATVDAAVEAAISEGIHFAIAAGNSNANACNYSPARTPSAITVGATTNTDSRSSFSNIGKCVDIFAPGTSITSSWIGSATAISTISGTSMAAPHVAGVVALRLGHLAVTNPSDEPPTPQVLVDWLVAAGTPGKITNPGTASPNVLLYSPFDVEL